MGEGADCDFVQWDTSVFECEFFEQRVCVDHRSFVAWPPARRWMECFSWSCIYYVRVGDSSFCVCCCVENLVFNFYIVFDVMVFVDCAVYLYLGSLLSFGLLGGEE